MKHTGTCIQCKESFVISYKRAKNNPPKFCGWKCYCAYRGIRKGSLTRKRATCHPSEPHAAHGLCSTCYADWHRRKNLSKYRDAAHRYCLKKNYGITPEQYQAMYDAQSGRCAICNEPEDASGRRINVDHSHKTSKVRELLCLTCNVGIGNLKESPDLLRKAIAYLEKHA